MKKHVKVGSELKVGDVVTLRFPVKEFNKTWVWSTNNAKVETAALLSIGLSNEGVVAEVELVVDEVSSNDHFPGGGYYWMNSWITSIQREEKVWEYKTGEIPQKDDLVVSESGVYYLVRNLDSNGWLRGAFSDGSGYNSYYGDSGANSTKLASNWSLVHRPTKKT